MVWKVHHSAFMVTVDNEDGRRGEDFLGFGPDFDDPVPMDYGSLG